MCEVVEDFCTTNKTKAVNLRDGDGKYENEMPITVMSFLRNTTIQCPNVIAVCKYDV